MLSKFAKQNRLQERIVLFTGRSLQLIIVMVVVTIPSVLNGQLAPVHENAGWRNPDDGTVAYLSGTGVLRANMLSGSKVYQELPASGRAPTVFRKAPYLIYSGVNTEMIALWQLVNTDTCSIEWGTDTSYNSGYLQTTEYGTDHQHTATISNLLNATKYYYRVIANIDTATGHFRTGPADSLTDVTILIYGDTRTYPADHDSVAAQIIQTYTNDTAAQSLLLLSGDLVGNGNNESDWDNQFFDPQYGNLQQMLRTLPLLACMGNHEGAGTLFAKYFPYPFYSADSYYWSFDYGPVHFTIIDQYTAYTAGSPQYQWLVSDLSGTTKKWKILILHEPGWSAGAHGNNAQVQTVLQPLCEQYGVQFVFAGHNHYYARAITKRVEHITTGGGGAPLYTPDSTYPNIVKVDKSYHFCKIEISADSLHLTVIKNNGTVIEQFDYFRFYTWTGSADSLWRNAANWEMGVVPSSTSDVVILTGLVNYPMVSDSVYCNKLLIGDGAFVNVSNTGRLFVAKN